MKKEHSQLKKINLANNLPWFPRKSAFILTIFSIIFTSIFYLPLATRIFIGIKALWPCLILGFAFFLFWSYPKKLGEILTALTLWMLIGPGIAGIWFWGIIRIFSFSEENLIIAFILSLAWTSGPVSVANQILKKFGLIAISKKYIAKIFSFLFPFRQKS